MEEKDILIGKLDLSRSSYKCLKTRGINTVEIKGEKNEEAINKHILLSKKSF